MGLHISRALGNQNVSNLVVAVACFANQVSMPGPKITCSRGCFVGTNVVGNFASLRANPFERVNCHHPAMRLVQLTAITIIKPSIGDTIPEEGSDVLRRKPQPVERVIGVGFARPPPGWSIMPPHELTSSTCQI